MKTHNFTYSSEFNASIVGFTHHLITFKQHIHALIIQGKKFGVCFMDLFRLIQQHSADAFVANLENVLLLLLFSKKWNPSYSFCVRAYDIFKSIGLLQKSFIARCIRYELPRNHRIFHEIVVILRVSMNTKAHLIHQCV